MILISKPDHQLQLDSGFANQAAGIQGLYMVLEPKTLITDR